MEGPKKGIRWFVELFQTLVAIPVLGIIIKELVESVSKKGAEKITKKVEQALGITVDEFGKGFGDEILFREALRHEIAEVQQAVEDFRLWLRQKDKKLAEAFVLGVAKAVKAFEKQTKKTNTTGGGKTGRPQNREERTAVEYDHSWSKNFFARLLARTTNEEKERFVFLEENFQSLIQPDKKPLIDIDKVAEAAKRTASKIEAEQKVNLDDLATTTTSWAERAKQWRDAAPKRG